LPSGGSFEFILEREKLEKISRVINHNGGKIISRKLINDDVQLRVGKTG